jgi:hypothetical protein
MIGFLLSFSTGYFSLSRFQLIHSVFLFCENKLRKHQYGVVMSLTNRRKISFQWMMKSIREKQIFKDDELNVPAQWSESHTEWQGRQKFHW